MKIRRFRVEKDLIFGSEAVIRDPREIRHLAKVLRLRPGDSVILFDGEGREFPAMISRLSPREVSFQFTIDPNPPAVESPLRIILGLGLLKANRLDWVFQKTTELGVAEVIPFYSTRVIPHLKEEKAEERKSRWEKIAAEAAKQCGRCRIPQIHSPISFPELLCRDVGRAMKILVWEGEKKRTLRKDQRNPEGSVFALVGPEGGFDAEEVAKAQAAGFLPIGLGPRILRADTAAIAIVTLLQYLWGDLGERHNQKEGLSP